MFLNAYLRTFCSCMVPSLEPRAVCTTASLLPRCYPRKTDFPVSEESEDKAWMVELHAFYPQGRTSHEQRHANSCLACHPQVHAAHPGSPAQGLFPSALRGLVRGLPIAPSPLCSPVQRWQLLVRIGESWKLSRE